jgi:tight adherence protein B
VLVFAVRPTKLQKRIVERIGQVSAVIESSDSKPTDLLRAVKPNRFVRLYGILVRMGIAHRLRKLIVQANSQSTPAELFLRCMGICSVSFLLIPMFNIPVVFGIPLAILLGGTPLGILKFQRSRRIKAFDKGLPDAIDIMGRALKAGHSVASAIEVVAEQAPQPISDEFATVSQEQSLGIPFRESLMNFSGRVESQDLQFLITAMLVQKETGGNLIDILDRTSHVIRERIRIHGEVQVKTAQGRLTGWILTALPVIMGTLINFMNPGFEKPLFYDPLGKMFLYCGCGMLVVGSLVVRKIVDIKV